MLLLLKRFKRLRHHSALIVLCQTNKLKCFTYFSVLRLHGKVQKTELQFSRILSGAQCEIVEFRIPGYPGPSKERDTEVRLMRGKIFRGKIRMYLQLYVVRNYNFKTISQLKKWNLISSE